jgi:hypothetical protein
MCIAAWLAVVGLSGLAARVEPRTLWLAGAIALSAASVALVHRFLGRDKTKRGVET